MTCIVGLVENGTVYMGGDAAAVGGLDIHPRVEPKVFKNGEFLIGYTSSFRMGDILQYFDPPEITITDLRRYMVTHFITSVREAFKTNGYLETHNSAEKGGSFLVGVRGRLFSIGSDFQVGESANFYDAVGCGEDYAMGSLFSTVGLKPKKRIEQSLLAAEHFSAGVIKPFTILKL